MNPYYPEHKEGEYTDITSNCCDAIIIINQEDALIGKHSWFLMAAQSIYKTKQLDPEPDIETSRSGVCALCNKPTSVLEYKDDKITVKDDIEERTIAKFTEHETVSYSIRASEGISYYIREKVFTGVDDRGRKDPDSNSLVGAMAPGHVVAVNPNDFIAIGVTGNIGNSAQDLIDELAKDADKLTKAEIIKRLKDKQSDN